MKRVTIISVLLTSIILCGCQNTTSEKKSPEIQEENTTVKQNMSGDITSENHSGGESEPAGSESISETGPITDEEQGGPYGEISLSLPAGWTAEAYPTDSDDLHSGMYGIRFYPEGVTEGCIELVYMDFFGVCGTELETEETTIAGTPAWIGTYDNHEYWSFISFQDEQEGIVAFTYSVTDWWSEYGDQILDILDTLSFDRSVKEGAACIFDRESEVDEIGLQFSLKDITGTGATLVFDRYDPEAASGELIYGDDFVIEIQNDGKWETVPVVLEGEYGFHDIAYLIKEETTESELNWEWLYGELLPGEYRIGKSVSDCTSSGDFVKYMVYAHFILN